MITMYLKDARTVLSGVLRQEVLDSLVLSYQQSDSIKTQMITIQKQQIDELIAAGADRDEKAQMLELIISNKDVEIKLYKDTIKKQDKAIRKIKRQKRAGFALMVILPAVVTATILAIKH